MKQNLPEMSKKLYICGIYPLLATFQRIHWQQNHGSVTTKVDKKILKSSEDMGNKHPTISTPLPPTVGFRNGIYG